WLIRGKWTLGLSKFSNKFDHFFRPKNRDFISKFHICPSHLQPRITQALSSTGPLSLSQIYSRQRFEQEQNQPCGPSSSTPDRRGIIPINASNSLIAKTIASICTCNLRLGLHISRRRVVSSSNLSNHAHVMDPYFLTENKEYKDFKNKDFREIYSYKVLVGDAFDSEKEESNGSSDEADKVDKAALGIDVSCTGVVIS
ncbi:Hypothetical predicted protein, partial [Olea europaea subsp. europaea]